MKHSILQKLRKLADVKLVWVREGGKLWQNIASPASEQATITIKQPYRPTKQAGTELTNLCVIDLTRLFIYLLPPPPRHARKRDRICTRIWPRIRTCSSLMVYLKQLTYHHTKENVFEYVKDESDGQGGPSLLGCNQSCEERGCEEGHSPWT